MSDTILPAAPQDTLIPPQPSVTPDDLKLDKAGIEAAAKKLGLTGLKADKLAASYTLGKALKQIGAIKIGRTMLYASATHAQEAMDYCKNILDGSADLELSVNALGIMQKLISTEADVGYKLVKSVEVDGSDDAENGTRLRSFSPGQIAGPTTVIAHQAVVNTGK